MNYNLSMKPLDRNVYMNSSFLNSLVLCSFCQTIKVLALSVTRMEKCSSNTRFENPTIIRKSYLTNELAACIFHKWGRGCTLGFSLCGACYMWVFKCWLGYWWLPVKLFWRALARVQKLGRLNLWFLWLTQTESCKRYLV